MSEIKITKVVNISKRNFQWIKPWKTVWVINPEFYEMNGFKIIWEVKKEVITDPKKDTDYNKMKKAEIVEVLEKLKKEWKIEDFNADNTKQELIDIISSVG